MGDPLRDWLTGDARRIDDTEALLCGFAERCRAHGVPIDRLQVAALVLDPLLVGRAWSWRSDTAFASLSLAHGELERPRFLNSPLKPVFDGRAVLRRRLAGPEACLDFPILEELAADGFTDYGAFRLESTRHPSVAIGATRHPAGLTEVQWAQLEEWTALLSLHTARHEAERTAAMLLDTYVGRRTGAAILAGRIRRGQVEPIEAVVWMCDMRDFTERTRRIGADATIAALNAFFEVMARAVHEHGGEVLKFLGDGMLVIFPTEGRSESEVCGEALAAARDALEGLSAIEGEVATSAGIALDIGTVHWGNIGATRRLDFTVIGECVNRVSRIEALCRPLGESILLAAAFARAAGVDVREVGEFAVRGLPERVAVFAPAVG